MDTQAIMGLEDRRYYGDISSEEFFARNPWRERVIAARVRLCETAGAEGFTARDREDVAHWETCDPEPIASGGP